MTDVQYPQMRLHVVRAVAALADPDYQRRVWVRRELPHPDYYDEFALSIHILYDDTQVLEDPDGAVGSVLRSPQEASALRSLGDALDALLDEYGVERSDEEYLDTPQWNTVVDAARSALAALHEDSNARQ